MVTRSELASLQEARRHGIGRLLLLARRDFLSRLSDKLNAGAAATFLSRSRLLPYIDVDGTRSTELARRMGVTKQAVGRMVQELEEAGLLTRKADPNDGRAFQVIFTPAGLRYLVRMHRAINEIEADYMQAFGEERLQQVRETLSAIAYGMPADPEAGVLSPRPKKVRTRQPPG